MVFFEEWDYRYIRMFWKDSQYFQQLSHKLIWECILHHIHVQFAQELVQVTISASLDKFLKPSHILKGNGSLYFYKNSFDLPVVEMC